MKDVNYYLFKGLDLPMAEYFAAERKKIVDVVPNQDFTLTLTFDTGETRLYDCKPFLKEGTVFAPFRTYSNFCRVYLDSAHCVSWDIDPALNSDIVWNNKVELCPDTCYVESLPIKHL